MKSAPLLRRWVERLRGKGVEFRMRHRMRSLCLGEKLLLEFETDGAAVRCGADVVVLALGGVPGPTQDPTMGDEVCPVSGLA
jgi:predicted flavoprotein YhiN